MITDLFSHKIHATAPEWPDKLVEIAQLFARFDGLPFNRSAIEQALLRISPRSSYARRDQGKFRDEISAYPAYLGLYSVRCEDGQWVMRLSVTAKRLLLGDAPDVASFLRLQLTLFQYPNASGAAYSGKSSTLRMQANAAERTLSLVRNGVHLSPLRLICRGLAADAAISGGTVFDAQLRYDEVYALANYRPTNCTPCPDAETVIAALQAFRNGKVPVPPRYERRFGLLPHTAMFDIGNGHIRIREPVDDTDRADLEAKFEAILKVQEVFTGFDHAADRQALGDLVSTGAWGKYFDGLRTLSAEQAGALTVELTDVLIAQQGQGTAPEPPQRYPLVARPDELPAPTASTRSTELADPEVTRIKRERRNLAHKIILDRLHTLLRARGAQPQHSAHIDIYAKVPDDGAFLFEAKSGGESLLEQVRKGLSQLYEYRFRYKAVLDNEARLCLVLGEAPDAHSWLVPYLCDDRAILVCWFDDDGALRCPPSCTAVLAPIVA